jgi:virulence-associated protein VapD
MSIIQMRARGGSQHRQVQRQNRVYAIAFDIDTQAAERVMGETWKSCYGAIERGLTAHGFRRMQGSLYFGAPDSNAVTCVLAVRDLDDRHTWFGRIVKDLRMLRIDEDNDLLPALNTRLRLGQADAS